MPISLCLSLGQCSGNLFPPHPFVGVGGACSPPPPVAAPLASSLRAPSRGDPPRTCSAVVGAWLVYSAPLKHALDDSPGGDLRPRTLHRGVVPDSVRDKVRQLPRFIQ